MRPEESGTHKGCDHAAASPPEHGAAGDVCFAVHGLCTS